MVCLQSGRPEAQGAKPLSGVHVVLVDDEQDIRDLFSDVLQIAGAHVRVASSAREALSLIEAEMPHVVVSDVMMPHEDGYWLIAAIRGMGPRRPRTLAITGDAEQHSRDAMLRAGYDAHLTKPIGADTLVVAVRRLAGRAP